MRKSKSPCSRNGQSLIRIQRSASRRVHASPRDTIFGLFSTFGSQNEGRCCTFERVTPPIIMSSFAPVWMSTQVWSIRLDQPFMVQSVCPPSFLRAPESVHQEVAIQRTSFQRVEKGPAQGKCIWLRRFQSCRDALPRPRRTIFAACHGANSLITNNG